MQPDYKTPFRLRKTVRKALKTLNHIVILASNTGFLFVALAFVVEAAPQPPPATLASIAAGHDIAHNFSVGVHVIPPDSAQQAINMAQMQSCSTYHFSDDIEDVGDDDDQLVASIMAPSVGSPTEEIEISLPLGILGRREIARFYSDPALVTNFVHIADIVGTIWLQTTDFDNTNFTIEVFDYNPLNGNTNLLGDLEFKIITDGQNEVALIITSSAVTIPLGHRFLFVLYGHALGLLATPNVTLYYNSINRDSRMTLCQITPPQLTITKSAPAGVVENNPITYTLTISNSGGLAADNLMISDTVPTNATYVSGGSLNGNIVTWSVATLPANDAVEAVFVVTATETITNSNYGVVADNNISSLGQEDVVTVVSQPGQPNLTISKNGPAMASSGEPITYTLTVANNGDSPAWNLVVSDTIPTGASHISGGALMGNIVTWNVISLPQEASMDFVFVVTATTTITNDEYLVVAQGGNMDIGSESVPTSIAAEPLAVYLPVIFAGALPVTLMIQSENTGGINSLDVRDPDNNNAVVLSCTIADNVTQLCGTFPAIGSYQIVADTNNCNELQGTFHDATPGATITRRIYCN